jgi:hypothetical protein
MMLVLSAIDLCEREIICDDGRVSPARWCVI